MNLKYIVDSENGNAKFDKSKKTLTIRLPVTGLTADSQRVAEQHYKEFMDAEKKRQDEEKSKAEELSILGSRVEDLQDLLPKNAKIALKIKSIIFL